MQTVYGILVELVGSPANDTQQIILYLIAIILTVFLILELFYVTFILARITR